MKNLILDCSADQINFITHVPDGCTANKPGKLSIIKKFIYIFCLHIKRGADNLTPYGRVFPLLILISLNISASKAQQEVNYALHANIIYRFTKYIDWPAPYNTTDFVIGIVGDSPLYEALESFVANKTVGSRKIVIKKMESSAQAYSCHILFVSDDKSKSLKKIAEVTKGSPILIISESNTQTVKWSCINFLIVNEHLKLEFNKTNIDNRNLDIASELLRLGTIVK